MPVTLPALQFQWTEVVVGQFRGMVSPSIFLEFGPIEDEVARRILSESMTPRDLWSRAITDTMKNHPQLDRGRLDYLWAVLENCPFDRIYPNYLNHPIRVFHGLQSLGKVVSQDIMETALCHNILELMDDEQIKNALFEMSREFLSSRSLRALATLRIDRKQEMVASYMAHYYTLLGKSERSLRQLKMVDKIDNYITNLLLAPEANYRERMIFRKFLVPMCAFDDAFLASYIEKLGLLEDA